MRYYFEWDPRKAKDNAKKHRVSFERAAGVFHDPGALTIFDEEHSAGENRWITMGIDKTGVLLVLVHTFQAINQAEYKIRIISARKATKKETQQYQEKTI